MSERVRAPFTPEQVESLNRFQASARYHPFTCGNDHFGGGVALFAREDGWFCKQPECDYRQTWAHAFMADGFWDTPL